MKVGILLIFRSSDYFRSPKRIPKFAVEDYSYGGRIPISYDMYMEESRGNFVRTFFKVKQSRCNKKLYEVSI
jgi:hypothetical protein